MSPFYRYNAHTSRRKIDFLLARRFPSGYQGASYLQMLAQIGDDLRRVRGFQPINGVSVWRVSKASSEERDMRYANKAALEAAGFVVKHTPQVVTVDASILTPVVKASIKKAKKDHPEIPLIEIARLLRVSLEAVEAVLTKRENHYDICFKNSPVTDDDAARFNAAFGVTWEG